MKFYGSGIIWDKKNNKRLCKFINGEFETEDERVIQLLIDGGYKNDGRKAEQGHIERPQVEEEQDYESYTVKQLYETCKEKGISYRGLKKAELIKALREGE